MWWTAITLGAVAAWFEWTYRRNRKAAAAQEKDKTEKASEEADKSVEPEQMEKLRG